MGVGVAAFILVTVAACGRSGFDSIDSIDGSMASGCARETVALCEDFEQGTIDRAIWGTYEVLGSVTVDNQRVHRGNFAMHVHTDVVTSTTNGGGNLEEDKVIPGLQAGLYVRTFAYLPGPAPTTKQLPIFVQIRGPTSGVQLITTSDNALRFYEWGSMPTDQSVASATSLPLDVWFCLEWLVDGSSNESRTWIDGTELDDLRFVGIQTSPLQQLSIGAFLFQATDEPAYDFWLDDIMVDALPIGCDR